jgi:DNA-binding NarL/FixJ family response regulator
MVYEPPTPGTHERIDPIRGRERLPVSTTVVIVEDHVMMAEGLRTAVNQAADIDVVGLAASLRAAVELIGELRPDVVVLDHPLPDGEAQDVIPLLRAAHPDLKVLVISGLADQRSVVQTLEAGADGYLLKSEPVEMLTSGIRAIQRCDRALSPSLLTNLITCVARTEGPGDRLTRRQEDVLQCLADGMSAEAICSHLRLSHNTVRNHTQRILVRLGAHSKLDAVTIALREGLVHAPGQHRSRAG